MASGEERISLRGRSELLAMTSERVLPGFRWVTVSAAEEGSGTLDASREGVEAETWAESEKRVGVEDSPGDDEPESRRESSEGEG